MNSIFFKISAGGNDFIIINNMKSEFDRLIYVPFVKKICCRKLSVGADGVIFIEKSATFNFKWRFFNSDGSIAEMCGNAAMCVARYSFFVGITGKNVVFETSCGVIYSEVVGRFVKIRMIDPIDIKLSYIVKFKDKRFFLNSVKVGVPHVVVFVNNIKNISVLQIGKNICSNNLFQPNGVNVNFVKVLSDSSIIIRTYERGVENETLSCGTGSVASALICSIYKNLNSPVFLTSKGGNLKVYFKIKNKSFKDIFLSSDVMVIYNANLCVESLKHCH